MGVQLPRGCQGVLCENPETRTGYPRRLRVLLREYPQVQHTDVHEQRPPMDGWNSREQERADHLFPMSGNCHQTGRRARKNQKIVGRLSQILPKSFPNRSRPSGAFFFALPLQQKFLFGVSAAFFFRCQSAVKN